MGREAEEDLEWLDTNRRFVDIEMAAGLSEPIRGGGLIRGR